MYFYNLFIQPTFVKSLFSGHTQCGIPWQRKIHTDLQLPITAQGNPCFVDLDRKTITPLSTAACENVSFHPQLFQEGRQGGSWLVWVSGR